ncbi:hypothetical protein FQR65_LT12517 [Abscondita terminalis]|nr:hypothetical protein FQR65_LT12517 [Abscondita terminalis]
MEKVKGLFSKEIKKFPLPRSGDPGDISSKSHWPYFKSLMFLKDQFTSRQSTGNLVDSNAGLVKPDMQFDEENLEDDEVENRDTIDESQDTINIAPDTPASLENFEDSSTGTASCHSEPRTI